MEKVFAVLLFERFLNKKENRLELPDDFKDEMENLGLEGEFHIVNKVKVTGNEGDIFLLKIKEDDTKVADLYYHKASHAANMSYSFKRKVELHVFSEGEIKRLLDSANVDEFLVIKNEIVSPICHLVFENGEVTHYGELYDIFGYL